MPDLPIGTGLLGPLAGGRERGSAADVLPDCTGRTDFGTLGLFPGYDARLAEPLTAAVKTAWEEAIAAAATAAAAGTAFDPTAAARRVALAEAAEQEQSPEDPASSSQTRGAWLEAAWQAAERDPHPGQP